MFLEPTILSIGLAKIRRGKLKNLEDVQIRGWYLLILSWILQFGLSIFKSYDSTFSNIIMKDYFFYLYGLSYLLLIIGVSLNIKKTSMKIFLFGLVLNCLVIFSNGGKMPVSIDGIKGINNTNSNVEIKINDFDIKHKFIDKNTKLPYLADIIRIPPPYPLPKIISIGDVFLMGGVFIFFQETMVKKKNPKYD